MYYKLDRILRGAKIRAICVASITATISPTWLEWLSSRILVDLFIELLGQNQIPLSYCEFVLPLLKYILSM